MGLIERFKSFLGAPAEVTVQLQGNLTQVSRAEFGALNKMADAGVVRKSGGDATVGLGTYTQGVPAFWFARAVETGGGSETLTNPYEKSVWVQRAIKKVAGPVAGVDLRFVRPKGGNFAGTGKGLGTRGRSSLRRKGTPRTQKQEDFLELPAITDWLRRPMLGLSYSDFVEASIGWLKMQECFWLLSDEVIAPFPEVKTEYPPIIVARPDMMREVIERGELIGWVFRDPGGKQHKLLPAQVIQLRYWNPYNQWRGLGEYPSASVAAEGDYLAGKFSRNLMANNGDFGGVIIAKNGPPTDPQREQIIMDLKAKRQAQLRGEMRYTFLTGDIDVKDPKIVSVDQAFNAQRLENRHEIALAFGVPPSMFDVKAAYSIGSASDYYQLITDTCIPTGVKFCDALEILINKLTGETVECVLDWETHPVMQAVRREAFDSWDKLCSRGMPPRDAGEYLGLDLPDFEGDDVGFVPINLTPISEGVKPPSENEALSEDPKATNFTEGNQGNEDKTPAAVQQMIAVLKSHRGHGPLARSKAARKRLWEGHMRQRSGTVKLIANKFNKVLSEYRGAALRKLATAGAITKGVFKADTLWDESAEGVSAVKKGLIDFIFDAKTFGHRLAVVIEPVIETSLQEASDQLRRDELGLEDPWKFPPHAATKFISGRKQEIQGVGGTVRDQLNTQLKAAYEKGEGMDDISDRVRGVFTSLSKGEADRVARTETGLAFNFARHEAGAAAGVKYKSWLSSHGPNVRPEHEEAEERYSENPIPLEEPFQVAGEELMHPGDPSGSAGNVINCQCIEIMEKPPADGTQTEEDDGE
jgi:hypothetical protein